VADWSGEHDPPAGLRDRLVLIADFAEGARPNPPTKFDVMSERKAVSPRIPAILEDPARNRGVAFSVREREELGLTGRLPSGVLTLGEQAERTAAQLRSLPDNLARSLYLGQLHDRNETLFFKVLSDHLDELLPIVDDPTAGETIEQFPAEHRRPRGIYLSIDQPDNIEKTFVSLGLGADDVDVIACSDAGDLPGVGDGGVAGVRIAAGKLAVYTAGAGIRPDRVIPVSLDVGTDNQALLDDPLYVGNRHARRRGKDYEAFIERYVQTASKMFPGALLHFQDFGAGPARSILQTYGGDYRVFVDNMQGTGAVALAAVYAATRVTGIPMKHQTMVVFGAGAAGVAVADQVHDAIVADGATDEQACHQICLVGRRGLLFDDLPDLRNFQAPYAKKRSDAAWAAEAGPVGLLHAIDRTAPTILLGASAVHRAFTRQVIQAMCQATSRPLILPISNPASRVEVMPADVIAWSDGRALVATGVPAASVEYEGTTFAIGQANSALIFPGIGLGVIVSRAARVTPHMLQAAAAAVAEQVDTSRPGAPLLPGVQNLHALSAQVAEAVIRAAVADKVATFNPTSLTRTVHNARWIPDYPDIG
jgi:malate dehydrogenase (oxaloacetate-decarboxylating)